MALFKSLRGKRNNLPSTKTDGYAYFCTDDGTFWIDYKDDSGVVQRKQINAKDAETLTGASLSNILNSSDTEIPTSKSVVDAINEVDEKASAQPDWNQNDDTAVDYVKNRPFYDAGSPMEFPVFNGESMAFTKVGDYDDTTAIYAYEMQESDIFTLTAGNTYHVTIDDETYIAECKDMAGACYLGNLSLAEPIYPNTGESFMIMPDNGVFSLTIAGETHNISIVEVRSVVEKDIIPDNEYTFSVMSEGMLPLLLNMNSFDLSSITEGDLCDVTFDGVERRHTVIDDGEGLLFGNLRLMGAGEDTGEPYLFSYNGVQSVAGALTSSTQHQFSIDKALADGTYESVVSDKTGEFTYSQRGYMMQDTESGFVLEADTTYKVMWNGVEYSCASIAKEITTSDSTTETAIYIGNVYKLGLNDTDSGEPFVFTYDSSNGFVGVFFVDQSFTDTHQIRVSCYTSGVKKLDKKYMPDNFDVPVASSREVGGVKVYDTSYNLSNRGDYSKIYLDTDDNTIYAKAPQIKISTTDLTAGVSQLTSGSIYLVYE